MARKFKTKVCEFWRECTCCLVFKTRDKYAYWKWTTWRQSICKECYNKKMNSADGFNTMKRPSFIIRKNRYGTK